MTRIGWEKFARARAQLDAGLDREAVLAEASVDVDTWRHEEEILLGVLADDVERADFANIEAYRKAYQTTWMEVTHLTVVEPPSTLESERRQSPLPPSPDPALPLQDAILVPAWTKRFPANYGGLDQTLPMLGLKATVVDPLPFTAGASARSTVPTAAPPVEPVTSFADQGRWDETMTVLGLTARAENPLPFTTGAPALPTAPAAAPQQEPISSGSADFGTETMWVPRGFAARSPLPFQSVIDPAPPSDPPTPRRGGVISTALPLSETAQDSPNGSSPDLTLEQYASLCAELTVFPQQVETIFQRYGLVSLKTRLAFDLAWRERLRRDVAEHHEWQRLYQRYQAYWADPTRRDGPT